MNNPLSDKERAVLDVFFKIYDNEWDRLTEDEKYEQLKRIYKEQKDDPDFDVGDWIGQDGRPI